MGKITLSVLPSGAGAQTKHAFVTTSDPVKSEFELIIKFETFVPRGYRVGSYLFNPSNEISAELKPGQSYETQVGIYNDSGRPVEIKKTVANNPNFTAKLETVEAGKLFNLKITSTDKLPVGTNKLFIKLLTDDPKQDVLEVAVIVNVAGEKQAEKTNDVVKTASKKSAIKSRLTKKK